MWMPIGVIRIIPIDKNATPDHGEQHREIDPMHPSYGKRMFSFETDGRIERRRPGLKDVARIIVVPRLYDHETTSFSRSIAPDTPKPVSIYQRSNLPSEEYKNAWDVTTFDAQSAPGLQENLGFYPKPLLCPVR